MLSVALCQCFGALAEKSEKLLEILSNKLGVLIVT
jgi:hypothetical protein